MPEIKINKGKKSKERLLEALYSLKERFVEEIDDDDVKIRKITYGLSFSAKKMIFFSVRGKIIATDGAYEITYETNAPDSKVRPIIKKLKKQLQEC